MFTGQRSLSNNNEVASSTSLQTNNMQGAVRGDGNGERTWSNVPSATDFNIYNNIRNSLATDEYASLGIPLNREGNYVPAGDITTHRQTSGRFPLDPLLIPRASPMSSQANSLVFEGNVPVAARSRSSMLWAPTNNQTRMANSFTPTSIGPSSLVTWRRASAPSPSNHNNLSRMGNLQPRIPASTKTSPWHGRSLIDSSVSNPRAPPTSSDQHSISSFRHGAYGSSSHQAPIWPEGSSNGSLLDSSIARSATHRNNSFGADSEQMMHSPMRAPNPLSRRNTFPNHFADVPEAMHNIAAVYRSRSVPPSPGMQLPSTPGFGKMEQATSSPITFGRLESNYARRGNFVGDAGSFGAESTGVPGSGVLEDAIRAQNLERVLAILEQGFSPNGERGSSETPPLLLAVGTGSETLVKLLLEAGANVNACDGRQYTALHYAVASGNRGIVNILLYAGANIYAKSDSDLLPVQLATDPAISEHLGARMKSDIEGRMSPRPTLAHSSIHMPDLYQWRKNSLFSNNRSTSFSEAGEFDRSMREGHERNMTSGMDVNTGSSQDHEVAGTIQGYREDASIQPEKWGANRQISQNTAGQAVGSSPMDWEIVRNPSFEVFRQGLVHRAFSNQSSNITSNENSIYSPNKGMDTWMQDGTSSFKGSLTRLPLQRVPSIKAAPKHNLNAPQEELLRQSIDPTEQATYSDVKSTAAINSEEAESDPSDRNSSRGFEDNKINGVNEEVDSGLSSSQERTAEMRKRFARACDSMAPSMMEKFRAAALPGHKLEVHENEEYLSEKSSGTPQAPETPRQEEKPETRVLDNPQRASSIPNEKADSADVRPASVLKGDARKMKEKKKTVTFAVAEQPTDVNLALIREDWHEAARSGCVGCGKPGCEGRCIAPDKQSSASTSEIASCSSSQTVPDKFSTNVQPTRTGSVRWTRGELLGEGAYGKVYAGLNQDTGELMAVKQLKLNIAAEGQERQFYLAALEREIALYKIMRHKHIVGYIDMEQDTETGSLYVFLEYVSGGSIQSMLERFGRFSEPLVRVYTRQLLLGLEYLHGKKIVHRDIKGGNVLVDADGVIKLADFGASKAFHDPTQTDGFKSIRGSVFWMAPEVIKGDGYGRRADIWSVGCTVVEMLTAEHPWPEMDNTWTAIFHIAKASSGPPIPEGVSDVVKDFLSQCFQLEARRRPTSTELLQHPFVAEIPTQT
nr:uncharacterized protein LOC112280062 isoform X3 [Physcomitrium patens]|eukprot:XP_024370794.1 uncharacterized protein LOC112280062 isoform X3 [Physcomitrella patens]